MKICFILFVAICINTTAHTQGCIMVRNISGFGQYNLRAKAFTNSDWQLDFTNRYFKAYRDFKNNQDQKTPKQDESIVKSFTTDFTLVRLLPHGWSLGLSIPILANSRSATLEHGGLGTPRHTTHTFGVGDIRLVAYKWILAPSATQKGNIQFGLGLKLPTGDYKYEDYFYRDDTTKVLAPVNGSISLGDGGTGITTELNGFYIISKSFNLYGNLYYLLNPRDQSGVSTTNGKPPTYLQKRTGADVYSVPDIYAIRGGIDYNYKNLSVSAGLREEGVPINDLLGESHGLRRPGHNLSFEPGLVYMLKDISLYTYVPVIISREIKQNLTDAMATTYTGIYSMGAGGSGDYSIFVGAQFRF